MSELMLTIAITYVAIGAVVGTGVATMPTVSGTWWNGNQVKYPRPIIGLISGIIWPYVLWKISQWLPK